MNDLTINPVVAPNFLEMMVMLQGRQPPVPSSLIAPTPLLPTTSQQRLPNFSPTFSQPLLPPFPPTCIASSGVNPLLALYQQLLPPQLLMPRTNDTTLTTAAATTSQMSTVTLPPAKPVPKIPLTPPMEPPKVPSPKRSPFREKCDDKCLPSTSALKEPYFEMGKLPQANYYPTHFMKGTVFRLANGKVKKVEDMNTDDFMLSSAQTKELIMEPANVVEVSMTTETVTVGFIVGQPPYKTSIEVQTEYPFFAIGKGWTSADPDKTRRTYGMDVQKLKVGDVCITLTRRKEREALELAVSFTDAQKRADKEIKHAILRDEAGAILSAMDGRTSAPPPRYKPYEKTRTISES